ncbi:MAG: GNAT family N-acetyltransferase [Phycisphaerales bacterium]|nr:MAG: GNAT family N-acetyltransferase [Phycisphaerales bacterium]
MRIREATNADTEQVKEIVFTALTEYGLSHDSSGVDSDLEDIEANYIRAGGTFEVVEDDDGRIIGCVGLHRIGEGVCELRKMYLKREARGKGLGKTLLKRSIERAGKLGFRRVELETAAPLKEAIALYEQYGFRPIESERICSRCDQAYALDLDESAHTQWAENGEGNRLE